MNWKEKDKKVRDVLAKRLFRLREKANELLHKTEQKCKFKEANEILSFLKTIDNCIDLIKFTNYGYVDFKIKHEEGIEEKQRRMFESLEEIEKILNIDETNNVMSNIMEAKIMINSIYNTQNEIKSLIMAFIPPKKKIMEGGELWKTKSLKG